MIRTGIGWGGASKPDDNGHACDDEVDGFHISLGSCSAHLRRGRGWVIQISGKIFPAATTGPIASQSLHTLLSACRFARVSGNAFLT